MHKEKMGHDFNPTQSCHGTPNISVLTMALTMNNKYVMESPCKYQNIRQCNKNKKSNVQPTTMLEILVGHHP
jgi:hypothetical protein